MALKSCISISFGILILFGLLDSANSDVSNTSSDSPIIKVKQGLLRGTKTNLVTNNGVFYSFKGIPYAAPPLGELRFKAPEPPVKWTGIKDAIEHGSMCPHFDIFTGAYHNTSEDCLFLNVYTQNLKPVSPLPVIFYIHGGGFKSGSGNDDHYSPDFLVQHDVVVVTINYRMELLGFLCLDTKAVPGNAGLKDQVAALKWIKQNIRNFGGDPDNVTIMGQSAGGTAATFHAMSPMSKGLFKRAIAMSGGPYNDWAMSFDARQKAFTVGRELGLDTKDPNELLVFLQNQPVYSLLNKKPSIIASEATLDSVIRTYHFAAVAEKKFGQKRFLTNTPAELLSKNKINDVDFLVGYTSSEFLTIIDDAENLFSVFNEISEALLPVRLVWTTSPRKTVQLSNEIRQRYFYGEQISNKTLKEFTEYVNDSMFAYYIQSFMKDLPNKTGRSRYFYKFSSVSNRNIYGNQGLKYGLSGVAHLDDIMYLFDSKLANLPIDLNSREYKLITQTCELITNFAKYGNPTPSGYKVNWPQYTTETQQYLDINDELTVGSYLDKERVDFWEEIFSK